MCLLRYKQYPTAFATKLQHALEKFLEALEKKVQGAWRPEGFAPPPKFYDNSSILLNLNLKTHSPMAAITGAVCVKLNRTVLRYGASVCEQRRGRRAAKIHKRPAGADPLFEGRAAPADIGQLVTRQAEADQAASYPASVVHIAALCCGDSK